MLKLEVVWSNLAKEQLKEAYIFIKKDSESAAKKVISKILLSTKVLSTSKGIYKLDELKYKNKGNYRAYVVYNYRITYKIKSDKIEIVRVRHTSRDPLSH